MKKVIMTAFVLVCALAAFADSRDDYRRFTDTIRAEVYAMKLPAFEVKDIPAKYKNESAVIKAVYEDVDAKKKTGFGRMSGTLRFSRKAQIQGSQLTRMLIHINDKAALEKYSELDFNTNKKTKYWDGYEKNRHAMGVRLIKPDGRTIDIDTSEFVEVEEGKKGEKKSRKLAIPGLETGDDIDIFYYTESKLQNVHPDPIIFTLRDDAPIMNYTIHCVVDDNLSTQYRTLNGAPDFNVTRDEDKNYVLDLEMNDIEREPRLWYNPARQSPMVKLYIYNRRNSDDFTPKSARKDGLQPNPDALTILEDRWDAWNWWIEAYPIGSMAQEYIRDGKKLGKTIKEMAKKGEITPQQAADYLYNLQCYIYVAKRGELDDVMFSRQFHHDLRAFEIPNTLGVSTTGDNEPLEVLVNLNNTTAFSKIDGDTPRYYFPPLSGILAPSELPADVQGQTANLWRKAKERKKKPMTADDFFTLPVSPAADNRNISTLNATFDGTSLKINREESYLGATKRSGYRVLSEEDLNEGYRAYLNRYGLSPEIKEKQKEMSDRAERYADGRKEQIDDFKNEIKGYHNADATEFVAGRVTNIGVDPADPALTYNVDYTMDNLVKRAGKNLILSVGRLMSGQVEVLPSDKEREDDMYMTTPREYVTRINVTIPSGYEVNARSLEALNTSVSNESGCFTVTATAPSAGTVAIEVTKRYGVPHLPAVKWADMLRVLDAATSWQTSTLLLDKR